STPTSSTSAASGSAATRSSAPSGAVGGDRDRARGRVEAQRGHSLLARAVARVLLAPEWGVEVDTGRRGVDLDQTGIEPVGRSEHAVEIAPMDGGHQAVADAVRDPYRLVHVGRREDRYQRSEGLLLAEAMIGPEAVDDRGRHEPAVALGCLPTCQDPCARRSSKVDRAEHIPP